MKLTTILFTLFLAFNAHAVSVDDFCSAFQWDNDKITCLKTARLGFIDLNALEICGTISFDSDKMNCMKSIIGKEYTTGEINTCANLTFDSEKQKCLVDLGGAQLPPENRRLSDIRKITITAQDSLRANDLNSVRRALDYILQLTSRP